MHPEGMVHALQEVHRLLAPAGCLINILPDTALTLIEVHVRGKILFSVPVYDASIEDVEHAYAAVGQVVSAGLFAIDQAIGFNLRTYAPSTVELSEYIKQESVYAERPSSEILALEDPAIANQLEALIRAHPGESQVVRMNPGQISRMRPIKQGG